MRGEVREQFGEKLLIRVISMLGLTLAIFSSNFAIFFSLCDSISFLTRDPSVPLSPNLPIHSHAQPSAHREIMGYKQSGGEEESEKKGRTKKRKWGRQGLKEEIIFHDHRFNFLFVVVPNGDMDQKDKRRRCSPHFSLLNTKFWRLKSTHLDVSPPLLFFQGPCWPAIWMTRNRQRAVY